MIDIESIVDIILRNHPRDCIFTANARENIIKNLEKYRYESQRICKKEFLDAAEQAFKNEEIYCPHEGIDKRKEFGII